MHRKLLNPFTYWDQADMNPHGVINGKVTTFTAEVKVKVPNRVNPHTHQFLNFRQIVTTFNLMETAVWKSYYTK